MPTAPFISVLRARHPTNQTLVALLMKTPVSVTVLLFLLLASPEPLVANAFQTELLNSYPLQSLPHALGLYEELRNAILQQPTPAGTMNPKSPEEAFIRLMQSSNGYQELRVGLSDPLNPIPASSEAKLQVAHQWLCRVLSTGFAEYLDETLSERVLYEELTVDEVDQQFFNKRRWDERTLHCANKFFARVQMELRLFTMSEAEDVDEALETLFTKCVVAPLLKDMLENTS